MRTARTGPAAAGLQRGRQRVRAEGVTSLSPRRKDPEQSLLDIIEHTPASRGRHVAAGRRRLAARGQLAPRRGRRSSGRRGGGEQIVALHEAAQEKYLNYALSVITSRALPDVRDGLKPVQRRILFTMWQQNLTADHEVPQVREGRRRRDGELPPARRHGHLRHARPHGAAVLAALSARRRLRQLRLARRRRGRRHAVHGVPPGAHRRRDAGGDRSGHGRRSGPTTTARRPSRSCCRRGCRTCSSTAPPASPSAWPPASRRTTSARSARRSLQAARQRGPHERPALPLRQGPRLPDRRPHPELSR